MDLRQLEVFAGVYELRSFSRAASALRLTQSTVSEHVRLLEEELGTRVFDRLSRETVPTRAGELLYGYARQMLVLRTEARQALDQFLGQVTGTLLVGREHHSGRVRPAGHHRPLSRAASARRHHAPDLGLARDRAGRPGRSGRRGRGGGRSRQPGARDAGPDAGRADPGVPPGHPWVGRHEATLEELRAEPLIVREPGSGSRQALERALRGGRAKPRRHAGRSPRWAPPARSSRP